MAVRGKNVPVAVSQRRYGKVTRFRRGLFQIRHETQRINGTSTASAAAFPGIVVSHAAGLSNHNAFQSDQIECVYASLSGSSGPGITKILQVGVERQGPREKGKRQGGQDKG